MRNHFTFGRQLKKWRRDHDLTQAMLARRVSCAEVTIQKIETGALRPSRQIAERMAEALALSPEERSRFVQLARGESGSLSDSLPAWPNAGDLPTRAVPIPPTPLIGRNQQVADVCATLMRSDVRLLTLIGPPGVGKTRLALAVASQMNGYFADGIFFVNLAPVDRPHEVLAAIARNLNLPERADQKLAEQLQSILHHRRLLLLLDNFEHLTGAAPQLAYLLAVVDNFKLLITSRTVLHISGEHIYSLAPLPTPDLTSSLWSPPDNTVQCSDCSTVLAEQPAVSLFVARARAVNPNFVVTHANAKAVAEICVRLDGLPLAIELAAARSKLFSPPTLLNRLQQRLALLTGGAQDLPTRQQTLRGAIDWSYELLSEREQTFFARLAIFTGGCTLPAVDAVCGDEASDALDLLAMLLDKSLVQQSENGEDGPRFTLLDTIREYALERLAERGEVEQLRRRHAEYFMSLAEQAEPAFEGSERSQQPAWLLLLDQEHDNIRAALGWCFTTDACTNIGVRLTTAVWQFWWIRGNLTEGRRWLALALSAVPTASSARAKLLNQAGYLAFSQADYNASRRYHEEGLALGAELNDKQVTADAYIGLANLAARCNDHSRSAQLFTLCTNLFQEIGDTASYAWSMIGLASVARVRGDFPGSRRLLEECRALFKSIEYKRGLAYVLYNLGQLAHAEGDFATALMHLNASLGFFSDLAERPAVAGVLTSMGRIAVYQEKYSQAGAHFRKSMAMCRELADRAGTAHNLLGLANATASEDPLRAARLWGAAEALRESLGSSLVPDDEDLYEAKVSSARERCEAISFESEWQVGRSAPAENTVLEVLHSPLG